MNQAFVPARDTLAALPLLRIETAGPVLHLRLNRPAKRNAINDALIAQLHTAFINLPSDTRAVVLSGEGEHFCAGLDLSELGERSTFEGVAHSRSWHATMDAVQFGPVPVVAVLHGAVVGGGLDWPAARTSASPNPAVSTRCPKASAAFVGGGGRRGCRGLSARRA